MWLEAALIAAVLVPVALRIGVPRLGWRGPVLGGMLSLALAAQLGLGSRTFPFVDWRMYASLPHGDPVVFEYDAVLADGRREALVPGHVMGAESADRFMEGLRRLVVARRWGELDQSLRVLAGMVGDVRTVVVSEHVVRVDDGSSGPVIVLRQVRVS